MKRTDFETFRRRVLSVIEADLAREAQQAKFLPEPSLFSPGKLAAFSVCGEA